MNPGNPLRYRWDPSLSMNPVRQFAHFMPPWWKLTKQFTTFHHRVKENKAPSCNYYFSAEPFLLRPFVRESIGPISFLMKNGMFFFFTYRWIRAMFVLTLSPSGEKVNTNMVLVHREVKMSTLGKIVKNCHSLASRSSQSEVMPIFVRRKTLFLGVFLD